MKQSDGDRTGELFGTPRRRGRPPNGKALTPAERQRRRRVKAVLEAECREQWILDQLAEFEFVSNVELTEMLQSISEEPDLAKQAWFVLGRRNGWL